MADVSLTWVLPTTRTSGKPLALADIKEVELFISADLGGSWASLAKHPPSVLEALVTELEDGEWRFRGIVRDTHDRESAPVGAGIIIQDATPPSPMSLEVALV